MPRGGFTVATRPSSQVGHPGRTSGAGLRPPDVVFERAEPFAQCTFRVPALGARGRHEREQCLTEVGFGCRGHCRRNRRDRHTDTGCATDELLGEPRAPASPAARRRARCGGSASPRPSPRSSAPAPARASRPPLPRRRADAGAPSSRSGCAPRRRCRTGPPDPAPRSPRGTAPATAGLRALAEVVAGAGLDRVDHLVRLLDQIRHEGRGA